MTSDPFSYTVGDIMHLPKIVLDYASLNGHLTVGLPGGQPRFYILPVGQNGCGF